MTTDCPLSENGHVLLLYNRVIYTGRELSFKGMENIFEIIVDMFGVTSIF